MNLDTNGVPVHIIEVSLGHGHFYVHLYSLKCKFCKDYVLHLVEMKISGLGAYLVSIIESILDLLCLMKCFSPSVARVKLPAGGRLIRLHVAHPLSLTLVLSQL